MRKILLFLIGVCLGTNTYAATSPTYHLPTGVVFKGNDSAYHALTELILTNQIGTLVAPLDANGHITSPVYSDVSNATIGTEKLADLWSLVQAGSSGTGSNTASINTLNSEMTVVQTGLANEITRATAAEGTNATAISTETSRAQTAEAKAALITGTTFTGAISAPTVTANTSTTSPLYNVNGAVMTHRYITFNTGTSARASFGLDSDNETGSNYGSSVTLNIFGDNGALLGNAFYITRYNQILNFTQIPTAPTAATADMTGKVATTQFVHTITDALSSSLGAETTRATGSEATLQTNINTEKTRAQTAESGISTSVTTETNRAQGAESSIITSLGGYLPLTGGTLSGALTATSITSTGNIATTGSEYVQGNIIPGGNNNTPGSRTIMFRTNGGSTNQVQLTATGTGTTNTGTLGIYAGTINLDAAGTSTVVTVPTATAGTNSTQAASTAYVQNNLASYLPLVGGTLSGNLNVGGVVSVDSTVEIGSNATTLAQGSRISWNDTVGTGETDFVDFKGSGGGGFQWVVTTPSAYGTNRNSGVGMSLDGAGSLTVNNWITMHGTERIYAPGTAYYGDFYSDTTTYSTYGGPGDLVAHVNNSTYYYIFGIDGSFVSPRLVAYEGTPGSPVGYSFAGDSSYDTGMFSPSDGNLQFYANGTLIIGAVSNTINLNVTTNLSVTPADGDNGTAVPNAFWVNRAIQEDVMTAADSQSATCTTLGCSRVTAHFFVVTTASSDGTGTITLPVGSTVPGKSFVIMNRSGQNICVFPPESTSVIEGQGNGNCLPMSTSQSLTFVATTTNVWHIF